MVACVFYCPSNIPWLQSQHTNTGLMDTGWQIGRKFKYISHPRQQCVTSLACWNWMCWAERHRYFRLLWTWCNTFHSLDEILLMAEVSLAVVLNKAEEPLFTPWCTLGTSWQPHVVKDQSAPDGWWSQYHAGHLYFPFPGMVFILSWVEPRAQIIYLKCQLDEDSSTWHQTGRQAC